MFEEVPSPEIIFEDTPRKRSLPGASVDDSYLSRVGNALPGALEGSARMILQLPGMVAGGLRGLVEKGLGSDEDTVRAGMESSAHAIDPNRLFPDTEGRTDPFNQLMSAGFEKAGELGGRFVSNDVPETDIIGPSAAEAIGQVGGQLATFAAPIPGAKSVTRLVERPLAARKLAVEQRAKQEQLAAEEAQRKQKADRVNDPANQPEIMFEDTIIPQQAKINTDLLPQKRQGELFTQERPFSPEDMVGKRFVTEDGAGLRNRPDDIEMSGSRGYPSFGGASEMANVPTLDRMSNQEPRQPNPTLPFERQTATQQVQEAVRQAAERRGEAAPPLPGSEIPVFKPKVRLEDIPKGQRGMAVIPFGKSAEALRDALLKKKDDISAALDRMEEAFKKEHITPKTYYDRRKELLSDQNTINEKLSAIRDAALNEHPDPSQPNLKLDQPESKVLPFIPKGQRGHIGDWDKRIAKGGLTKTMLDMKREIALEKRDLPEILEAGELDPKRIQDIAPESEGRLLSLFKRGASHLLIDRTMARLSRERPGSNTLIKWEADRREAIDNRKDIGIRDAVKDGISHWINRVTGHPLQVRQMLDVWQEAVGKDPLSRESFKTEKQWQMFQKSKAVLDKARDDVNTAREKAGKQPLPHLENYFPAIWEGDYRIWVYDQAGTKVGGFGLKTEYGANRMAQEFRKKHPELDVRNAEHVPKREQYHDLTAFEEAIQIHRGDYAATKALQQTYSRLLQTKGMGAHGLFRSGIFGYLGMEPGKLGVANSQKAFEIYVKRAYNHIANLEKNDLAMQVDKLPQDVQQKIPNTITYLKQTLNLAKGVDTSWTSKFPDYAFEELGYGTGLGRSIAKRAINEVASVASLAMLSTVRFLTVQPLQYLNTMSKLQQLRGRIEGVTNMPESMLRGAQGALGDFARDAIQNEAIAWANKNEKLQATLIDVAGMRATDPGVSALSKVGNSLRFTLGADEKYTVRTPSFLAFEYALRNVTPNKTTRFEQAAALMDYQMVHYDNASSPRIYSELGLLGEAARPLKQYSHNAWGQLFELIQGAKNHAEFAPLAIHLATQISVGGIRGLIGLAEATAIITAVNTLFDQDIPTPSQLVIEFAPKNNKIANALLFGIPSTMSGWDISGTVTAPTIPQMFGVFPVAIAGKAALDSLTLLIKYANGTQTDADVLRALQSSSPAAMREFWTEMFSEPGQPAPHANMEMGGTFVRDETEKFVASAAGLKSIPEARADEVMRQAKQVFLRDQGQKHNAIRAITDRAANHKEITPDLIQRYIAEGGDPKNLNQAIKQELINRSLPWMDRQLVGKEMTPQKAHKLEILKQELDREFKRREEEKNPIQKQSHETDKRHPGPDMKDSQLEFNQMMLGASGPERQRMREIARQRGVILPPDSEIELDEATRRQAVRERVRRKQRTGSFDRSPEI